MAKIHLMVGFMGFGKTTISLKLAEEYKAIRLCHDEVMVEMVGRNLPESEFRQKWKIVDEILWKSAADNIAAGHDVIMDYGFWSAENRKLAFERAKTFCSEIIFHQVDCDIKTAKQRVLKRTAQDESQLLIDENCFDIFAKQYQAISPQEGYVVINHKG